MNATKATKPVATIDAAAVIVARQTLINFERKAQDKIESLGAQYQRIATNGTDRQALRAANAANKTLAFLGNKIGSAEKIGKLRAATGQTANGLKKVFALVWDTAYGVAALGTGEATVNRDFGTFRWSVTITTGAGDTGNRVDATVTIRDGGELVAEVQKLAVKRADGKKMLGQALVDCIYPHA